MFNLLLGTIIGILGYKLYKLAKKTYREAL